CPAHLGVRPDEAVDAASLAHSPARRPDRPRGAKPHRRTLAQPGPGPHRDAPARVLHAAVGGPAVEPVKLEIELIEARLRAPFVSARTSVKARRLGLVRLQTADGTVGHGEAAPLEGYDAASLEDVLAALGDCREPLSQSDGEDREELLNECARRAVLPHATAA